MRVISTCRMTNNISVITETKTKYDNEKLGSLPYVGFKLRRIHEIPAVLSIVRLRLTDVPIASIVVLQPNLLLESLSDLKYMRALSSLSLQLQVE